MASLTPRLDSLTSYSNLQINSNFDFWQRGTSITNRAAGDTNFLADRYKLTLVGTSAVYRMDRSTDVPTYAQSGFQSSYSLAIQCTTADAAVAAGDLVMLRHTLEGYDYAQIANGAPFRKSFWVKSVKAGTYCLSLNNDANNRYQVKEYTLAANTWTKVVFDLTSDTSGTWLLDNGGGLSFTWTLMAGTTFQGTANTWGAGNIRASSSQVNFSDSTSNIFYLAQDMTVAGSFSSTADLPFKRAGKTIQQELAMCSRYLGSYNFNSVSGPFGQFRTASDGSVQIPFMVQLRAVPTAITLVGGGTYLVTVSNGTTTSISNPTFNSANVQGAKVDFTGGTGGSGGAACQLVNTTSGAAALFDAEL